MAAIAEQSGDPERSGRDCKQTPERVTWSLDTSSMDRAQAEPIIKVLLDLQRIGKHETSIALLDALLPMLSDPQQIRQVWYWQAEAYRALNKPKVAASLYLRSAGFSDELLTDPWGQYVRFYAAEALSEAGLIEDSRRIYEQLLRNTEATGHRAVILHKLQLLPLKK
jgi:tetratricopeptide (TPR) repeat protein